MRKDFDKIVAKHKDKIFKTCLGFAYNEEDAKDLVQEVFINIWSGLSKFKREAKISTWIYRLTINTCLMHKRKKQIEFTALKEDVADYVQVVLPTNESVAKDLLLLRKYLNELEEKDRVIMILYLENLQYDEIAEITGLTKNYIGVKISRIKNNLKLKFENHGRN